MRQQGMNGLVRGKKVRTTGSDPSAERAPDLLDRDFTAMAPNLRWVADFTYARTWAAFAHVSFVIDCYSRTIVGWHAAMVKTTPLVTTALRMALRQRESDSIPAGEARDNALAETMIGTYRNEAIRDSSPFRDGPLCTRDDVEWVTLARVDWHNQRRLHSSLDYVPREEDEAAFFARLNTPAHPVLEPA